MPKYRRKTETIHATLNRAAAVCGK